MERKHEEEKEEEEDEENKTIVIICWWCFVACYFERIFCLFHNNGKLLVLIRCHESDNTMHRHVVVWWFFFMSIFWSIKINFQMKKFSRWSVNWASHSPSFLFNLESRNWRWKSDDADDEKISPRERAPTACICAKRHIRSVGCRVRERENRAK